MAFLRCFCETLLCRKIFERKIRIWCCYNDDIKVLKKTRTIQPIHQIFTISKSRNAEDWHKFGTGRNKMRSPQQTEENSPSPFNLNFTASNFELNLRFQKIFRTERLAIFWKKPIETFSDSNEDLMSNSMLSIAKCGYFSISAFK